MANEDDGSGEKGAGYNGIRLVADSGRDRQRERACNRAGRDEPRCGNRANKDQHGNRRRQRREEGEYREYSTDEQRSAPGCSVGRM